MKPIPLTDKHKEKLLEMCQNLFQDNHFSFGICDRLTICDITYKYHRYRKPIKCYGIGYGIHWFEFCMTHLCYKLFGDIDTHKKALNVLKFHSKSLIECEHPVDYLYKQFKKMK